MRDAPESPKDTEFTAKKQRVWESIGDIALIRQACWDERALHTHYSDSKASVSERTILPLTMMYTSTTITILAWCLLREEFRMFRIDRIIQLSSTEKSFRPRRITLLREYLTLLKARENVQENPAPPTLYL